MENKVYNELEAKGLIYEGMTLFAELENASREHGKAQYQKGWTRGYFVGAGVAFASFYIGCVISDYLDEKKKQKELKEELNRLLND